MSNGRSDNPVTATSWHATTIDDTLQQLGSQQSGITREEAEQRLQQFGPNRLTEPRRRGVIQRFLLQFHNVLIYVLMVAGVVTALLQHWVDASVIFGVVLINALIGVIQEGKAENALRAIRQMLSPSALVLRDAKQQVVAAEMLVPGDLVLLQSGDKVPADLRLLRVKGLQIQEAALTGESVAVSKQVDPVDAHAVLGDQNNMAFSGTLVTHGQGTGVVVTTGATTQIGRISTLVADVENVTTPLLRQLAQFGRWLTAGILVIALINFVFGILIHAYDAATMFLASVSLAVAAIPEGLPAILTITLAIGVQRMARRNAIIRKLPAVETLGSVSVICSDKTGTLTRNEMTVRSIATSQHCFEVSGIGYNPHGTITLDESAVDIDHRPLLQLSMRAAGLCNDASVHQQNGQWQIAGDPMEAALLIAAGKAGLDIELEQKQFPRNDLIPFESEHRFMATLHHSHAGEAFVFIKGAPERILEMCIAQKNYNTDEALRPEYWQQRIEELANRGQRVLAIAMKRVPAETMELAFADVEGQLTLLACFGLIDPPREEAIDAVASCQRAGIRVKMITGDHGATALAIARQLGLLNTREVLTGLDLESMSNEQLGEKVANIDVFARVNPEHKLELVRQLQERGFVVAMTGDGVNDAPALKRADVGTAMGKNGTEAAKEAAEMVLVDDNFATITSAVEEGRTVYDNITKSILFILPTNGGEALVILGAVLLGFQHLPLTPVQILWVNMITAVTLALALAFEPSERRVMQRPPRDVKQPILTLYLLWRVLFVAIILMCGTFGIYLWDTQSGASLEHARTAAVNTLVMFEIFYLFNARYLTEPVLNRRGLTENPYVLVAIALLIAFQMGFTYIGWMQRLFGTTALAAEIWLYIVLVGCSVLFLVELEKFVIRLLARNNRKSRP